VRIFEGIIATAALVLTESVMPTPVSAAGFNTGNALYTECTTDETSPVYFAAKMGCTAYIVGAADSLESMRSFSSKDQCIPENTSKQQVTDVVIKYLRDNPEQRHFTAASTAMLALSIAFNCK
jgi:hypothetical protein